MVSFSLKLFINASKKLTLFWFVTSDRPYRNRHATSTSVTKTLFFTSTTLGISGSLDAVNVAIAGILRSTMPNAPRRDLLTLHSIRLTPETSTNTSTATLKVTAMASQVETSRWRLESVSALVLARRWEMLIQALVQRQGSSLKRFQHPTNNERKPCC